MNIGAIGIDSGHLEAFTKLINARNKAGTTRCRVSHFWSDGSNDWVQTKNDKVRLEHCAKWKAGAIEHGAVEAKSLEEMLKACDGFMVLNVSGGKHSKFAEKCLKTKKPTYVDKPLTTKFAEAKKLLALSRKLKAPCYSASSLRFIAAFDGIDFAKLGKVVAVDAYGPGELLKADPHLWHYGCHAIEMVDSIFARSGQGAGVKKVSAVEMADRHLLDLEYRDGRYVSIRLERKGSWEFGGIIHGEKGAASFRETFGDGASIYDRLIGGMVSFFEGKGQPVPLRDIVETVAVMDAGNASIKKKGAWVNVPAVK
ncbi:MAG: Gfo/Idh/MocA family protein [bacterium]|jgi:predicted dehydrogenase|nr:Gfo/Idh/MocA family oxidoreductase [Planctomycetaceae bacterium]